MFKLLKKYKGSIFAAIAEVVIVFIGISISLYIDDWREEKDNRSKEDVYLEEIYYDITDDLISMNNRINFINTVKNRLTIVLGAMHYPDSIKISPTDLKQSIGKFFILENFVTQDYTFRDLTSTGNIKLITNKKIRKLIYSYYSKIEQATNVEEINNKATSEVLTNDLMKLFPIRKLFDYQDWFIGIDSLTFMDTQFFNSPNSEQYIGLESAFLFRASLLRLQLKAYSFATFDAVSLRDLIGDYLGIPNEKEFINQVINDGISPAKLFENLKDKFSEYTLLETILNDLTYDILKKHPKEALELFKLNVELYPNSPNVYDSLGDGYLANGDKENALINFKKAVEGDPLLLETKQKIVALESSK